MSNKDDKREWWKRMLETMNRYVVMDKEHYNKCFIQGERKGYDIGELLESYASATKNIGIFEYLLNNNIALFKEKQIEALKILLQAFSEEKIAATCINMRRFENLFLGLSAGEFEVTKQYAEKLHTPKGDLSPPTKFPNTFGYTLKYFVLEELEKAKSWLADFKDACKNPGFVNFKGYPIVFEAVMEKDVEKANAAFIEVNKGYIKECKGRGDRYFQRGEPEDINTWGIGMANLCKYYGLDVQIENPLIPKELLIEVRK